MVPNTEESLREIKQNGLYYVTDLFGQEKARLNQIRYALGDDALQYDADAAQAVAAMITGHKSAANMTPADELKLPSKDLAVARLRVLAKAVNIATETYNSATKQTSLIRKGPLLATLRAHYGVEEGEIQRQAQTRLSPTRRPWNRLAHRRPDRRGQATDGQAAAEAAITSARDKPRAHAAKSR